MAEQPTYLLRRVTGVESDATGVTLSIAAFPGVEPGGTPGWLTGEDVSDLGVELTLPNLPTLKRPDPIPRTMLLRVDAIAADAVRLRIAPQRHWVLTDDGTGLGIVTDPGGCSAGVREDQDQVVVSAGDWELAVQRYPFGLRLRRAGRLLTRTAERLRQVAGLPVAPAVTINDTVWPGGEPGVRHRLALELGVGEDLTGFGEQFGRLVKNGQAFELKVADALGTGAGLAYKPVPVWHSSNGWLGLLNTGCAVQVDAGHSLPSVLQLGQDDAIDLYLVVGDTAADRLAGYTRLTGRAECPPPWAFGYWMGRCRYQNRDEMLAVADGLRRHDIPADVLHLDPAWLVVDWLNTDFIWNNDRFGDRREFCDSLAERGFRLSVWELPYLDPASPRYAELERAGYLVRDVTGATAAVQRTPAPDGRPRALFDFTNPAARDWWQEQHTAFLADGVAVFKTDFGEGLPDDALLARGLPAVHAHNLYPLYYNESVYAGLAARLDRPAMVWGRSGWAGSHRAPGQWGGDAESSVVGMQATLRGGLSYALGAPGLWSHDIGGFFGPELTPALYVRWTQFGALSPLMRAHGLRPREPWRFGARALRIARGWIRVRYSLLPYLWNQANESLANGWPLLRPLDFHREDTISRSIDHQFLLGRDLLVAPVFDDDERPVCRRVWLPEGVWHPLAGGPGGCGRTVRRPRMCIGGDAGVRRRRSRDPPGRGGRCPQRGRTGGPGVALRRVRRRFGRAHLPPLRRHPGNLVTALIGPAAL